MTEVRQRKILAFFFPFCFCLAGCLLAVAIPDYAHQYCHATPFEIGMLGTISSLGYTLTVFGLSRYTDRWGVRLPMTLAFLLFTAAIGVFPMLHSFWQLVIAGIVWNVASAFFWPTFMGWLAAVPKGLSLSQVLAVFNIAWCLGQLFGDYFSGETYGWGYTVPFFIAAVITVLLTVVLWIIPAATWRRGDRHPCDEQEDASVEEPLHPRTPLFRWIGWGANFAGVMVLMTVRTLFPPLAADLGYAPRISGILLAVMPVTQMLLFWYLGRWQGWHFRLWPLIALQVLAAVGCLLAMPALGILGFGAAFLFVGLIVGLAYTSSLYYSVHGQADKSRQAGIHEGIGGMGAIAGPALFGATIIAWGQRAPYLGSAILFGILTLLQVVAVVIWTRRKVSSGEKATVIQES